MNVKIPPTGTIPVRIRKVIRETNQMYLMQDAAQRLLWVPKSQAIPDIQRASVFHFNVEFAAQNGITSNVVLR